MSLINEALKKAQRARTVASAEAAPIPGGRVTKRAQPRTAQQLVLIAAGAIVLVVLSVVATVYLVNREPEPKPAAPVVKPATPTPAGTVPTSGVVVPALNPSSPAPAPSGTSGAAPATTTPGQTAPAPQPSAPTTGITVPIVTQAPTGNPATPSSTPAATAPGASAPVAQAAAPAPIVVVPTPTTVNPATAVALVPPKPDERVAQYIDTIRVSAVRAIEGRVLMNDRVYKINDIVERGWGLRLTKVEPGVLTFTDANGAVYVRTL